MLNSTLYKITKLFTCCIIITIMSSCNALHNIFDAKVEKMHGNRINIIDEFAIDEFSSSTNHKIFIQNDIQYNSTHKNYNNMNDQLNSIKIMRNKDLTPLFSIEIDSNNVLPIQNIIINNISQNENTFTQKQLYPTKSNFVKNIKEYYEIYAIDHFGVIYKFIIDEKNHSKLIWKNTSFKKERKFINPSPAFSCGAILYKQNHKQSMIIASNGGQEIIAIDSNNGKKLWRIQMQNLIRDSISILRDNFVIVTSSDGAMHIIDANIGKILWSNLSTFNNEKPKTLGISQIYRILNPDDFIQNNNKSHSKNTNSKEYFLQISTEGQIALAEISIKIDQKSNILSAFSKEFHVANNMKFANKSLYDDYIPIYKPIFEYNKIIRQKNKANHDLFYQNFHINLPDGSIAYYNIDFKNNTINQLWNKKYRINMPIASSDFESAIYTIDKNKDLLIAINKHDGKILWRKNLSNIVENKWSLFGYINKKFESPIITKNHILIIEKNTGNIYCFNKQNGDFQNQKYNFGKNISGCQYFINYNKEIIVLLKNNGQIIFIEIK